MKLYGKKYRRNGEDALHPGYVKYLSAILLFCICHTFLINAGAQTIFQRSFSNGTYLCGNDIQLHDGYYYIGGTAKEALTAGFFLMRTDNYGDSSWTREYKGSLAIEGKKIILQDGFIYIAGNCNPNTDSAKGFLAKTTREGLVLWSKTFGSPGSCLFNDGILWDDTNLVLTGSVSETGSGNKDIFVAVFDTSGSVRWAKTYGKPGNESGNAIIAVSDSGFYLTGNIDYGDPDGDIFILKLAPDGTSQWCKTYNILHGGFSGQNAYDLIRNSNNQLVVSGNTKIFEISPTDQIWNPLVMKTDMNGNVIYAKEYNLNSGGGAGYQVMENQDGSFAFTGYMRLSFGLLVKTDQMGETAWSKVYGFDQSGSGYLNQTKAFIRQGNSFVMTGFVESQNDTALYLIKTNHLGETGCIESEPGLHAEPNAEMPDVSNITLNTAPFVPGISDFPLTSYSPGLTVYTYCVTSTGYQQPSGEHGCYPNPVKDFLYLPYFSGFSGYRLANSLGNQIASGHDTVIDFRPFRAGLYFLTIYDHESCHTYKIIRVN